MERRVFSLALAAALLLAGCLSDETNDDGTVQQASGSAEGAGGASAPELVDDNTTGIRAPDWEPGDWWEYRVTDLLTGGGNVFEGKQVVAGKEGDFYLVGMPRDEFSHELMVMHIPGFGQVDQLDLGFEQHDALFIPTSFPLEEGKTWQTAFEGQLINGAVTEVSGTEATVVFTKANGALDNTIVYDSEVGNIVSLERPGYAKMELLDHGSGFDGIVTVPHEHDLIFVHGRIAGAVGFNLQPAPPVETVTIDDTYDRVSFALILGPALGLPVDPGEVGYYQIDAQAPDGTDYSASYTPTPGGPLYIEFHGQDFPGGDWNIQYIAGGGGVSFIEGIAYHVFDVDLSTGCILMSEGEHAHGGCADGGDHTGHGGP